MCCAFLLLVLTVPQLLPELFYICNTNLSQNQHQSLCSLQWALHHGGLCRIHLLTMGSSWDTINCHKPALDSHLCSFNAAASGRESQTNHRAPQSGSGKNIMTQCHKSFFLHKQNPKYQLIVKRPLTKVY